MQRGVVASKQGGRTRLPKFRFSAKSEAKFPEGFTWFYNGFYKYR